MILQRFQLYRRCKNSIVSAGRQRERERERKREKETESTLKMFFYDFKK